MSVETVAFGCRLNIAESDAMRRLAEASGRTDHVIVNTCAVTAQAARRSRQAVRRALRERPTATVVATGCAAEISPADFADASGRVRLMPNATKSDPAAWGLRGDPGPGRMAGQTRGALAVQNGCDHRCTFCVIPFGRGASRSTPASAVVAQARALVEAGHSDVILTGVDLASWGADLPGAPTLGGLVREILAGVPSLRRLRLSSLDCVEIDDALLAAFAEEERLMPHLHLSLQAGDDLVLKRMRRRHSRADVLRLVGALRRARPDVVLGADLIAGFPTETEAMAANTLALVEDCGLTHLHVFPFSARPGTPAARMPPVAPPAIAARAAALRAAGARRLRAHFDAQVGRTLEVLAERGGVGRARDFSPVRVAGVEPGAIVAATIAGHDGERLIAA